jgi:hypothetical protein
MFGEDCRVGRVFYSPRREARALPERKLLTRQRVTPSCKEARRPTVATASRRCLVVFFSLGIINNYAGTASHNGRVAYKNHC